jgi:voltage-gated potassium channel
LLPNDLTARRAGRAIALITIGVTIAGGIVMWLVDREDFPTLGSGMWWSVQTITTVGYGDNVPTSTGGKAVAALVMVMALGFLSVVTASISAMFVESARRRRGVDAQSDYAQILERLERIEQRLDADRPVRETDG